MIKRKTAKRRDVRKKKIIVAAPINVITGLGNVTTSIVSSIKKGYRHSGVDITVVGYNINTDLGIKTVNVDYDDFIKGRTLWKIIYVEKPDVVVIVNDLSVCAMIIKNKPYKHNICPMIAYAMNEGDTIDVGTGQYMRQYNLIFTPLMRTKMLLEPFNGNVVYLPHGIDTNTFRPLDYNEVKKFHDLYKVSDKNFIIGAVNRFQQRKNWAATLRAIALIIGGYKECKVCGAYYPRWMPFCDVHHSAKKADDEYDDIIFNGDRDIVAILHTDLVPPSNSFAGTSVERVLKSMYFPYMNNIRVRGELANGLHDKVSITSKDINILYNLFDVFVDTSHGEGFGLTPLEAYASGTGIILSDISSFKETLGDANNVAWINAVNAPIVYGSDNNFIRYAVDVNSIVDILYKQYMQWQIDGKKHNRYRENIEWIRKNYPMNAMTGPILRAIDLLTEK